MPKELPTVEQDMLDDNASTVEFTAELLAFIMIVAGTTVVRARQIGDKFSIYVGSQKFTGTKEEAFHKLFKWLLTVDIVVERRKYDEASVAAEEKERVATAKLIDELVMGGEGC